MTATCRESCCSATPRLSVGELFERGFRRNRQMPLPIEGSVCTDADGNNACFSLEIDDGRIAAVGFRASSCATLIAYCEFIAESLAHVRPAIAQAFTAADLAAAVPGVPAFRQQRAVLAVAALRAAIAAADPLQTGE